LTPFGLGGIFRPMTVAEIEARAALIAQSASEHDDEAAHSREDALYRAVLRAIAEEEFGDDPVLLAQAALRTAVIRFKRWYE